MPQVLLINPVSRKEIKTMAKKARSAAQQRATRKMIAANRARRKAASGGTTKRKAARRVSRAKPRAQRRPARASNPAPMVKRKARRPSKRAATAAGRTLRYRRKNPVGGVSAFVKGTLVPSAVGGAGALVLDLAMNMLPLPPAMKTGPMRPVVKVVGAIGLGMLASKVTSRQTGGQVAAGALTVTLYELARGALAKNETTKKLFGLGEYGGEESRIGEYVGEYVGVGEGEEVPGIGYQDSGMQVGDLMPDGSVEGYETGVYR